MTNYRFQQETCEHLGRIVEAARQNQTARGAVLLTHDPDSALMSVREMGRVHAVPIYAMSMAGRQLLRPGARAFDQVAGPAADPVDVLRAGGEANGPALVLFKDMLRFVSDTMGDPRARAFLWQMLSAENRKPHTYVFCEPPEGEAHLPAFARTLLSRVVMPLPRGQELVALTKEELAIASARWGKALEGETLTRWAHRLAAELPGLTQSAARFALQDALSHGFDLEGAVRALADRKAAQLQAQLAMQVLRPVSEPPVGMDHYYRWLRLYQHLMCVPGPERVKGAVLIGPPGTGKTRLGAYTAYLLGVPAVWFRFGALLGMYVGQSEAMAERAFAVLDALGTGADSTHERGVVILMDELEKTITRGDNDGGVSMRVTARMLTWMSESTAPNMILATANDLESMGELADIITRRGRLDRVFFVDVPNQEARRQLFERLLTRTGADGSFDFQELAERSERFSGADIEVVVRDAKAEAQAEKQPLTMAYVVRQIERSRIRVLAAYDRFHRLREWARVNAEMAGPEEGGS